MAINCFVFQGASWNNW